MKGIFSRPPILIMALAALFIAALFITGCDGATVQTRAVVTARPATIKTVLKNTIPAAVRLETARYEQSSSGEVLKTPMILAGFTREVWRPRLDAPVTPIYEQSPEPLPVEVLQARSATPRGFAGSANCRAREKV